MIPELFSNGVCYTCFLSPRGCRRFRVFPGFFLPTPKVLDFCGGGELFFHMLHRGRFEDLTNRPVHDPHPKKRRSFKEKSLIMAKSRIFRGFCVFLMKYCGSKNGSESTCLKSFCRFCVTTLSSVYIGGSTMKALSHCVYCLQPDCPLKKMAKLRGELETMTE